MSIKIQPVTLDCAPAIENLRKTYRHQLSSHAFVSLYLWREQMSLSLYLEKDVFSAKCGIRGENAWFFPCGDKKKTASFIREVEKSPKPILCYLRKEDVEWLTENFPDEWEIRRLPEGDEYLYDTKGHEQLLGKTYANMRTQVHKVEREYHPQVRLLDETTKSDALSVVEEWSYGEHKFGTIGIRDDDVDKEAICMQKELGIKGIVLYLDEKPVAVTAGFLLADDVFDMVIAKSNVTLQGVSYYSKRELFIRSGCKTVNMEEDLGIEGLRRMKQGLKPYAMNEIWEAYARK